MRQLRQIFSEQKSAFDHFFTNIDVDSSQKVLDTLVHCKGHIHFTGIGKSGLVAKKLAKTFCATGTRAHFLDPIDALHGDFGLVQTSDLVVILSKSAKSHELLPFIALLKNQGIRFMLWACSRAPHIQGACAVQILPLKAEVCPFKRAPLTSSALQLVFGNCMASALMLEKGFTLDRYSINHSGGSIGRGLSKIRDVMVKKEELPLAYKHETLEKKLVVLSQKRLGSLLIIDKEQRLIGIFTDGDLRRAIQDHGPNFISLPLDKLMTKNPRIAGPDLFISEALRLMNLAEKQITALPVVKDAKLVGLVHLHQIS